MLTKATVEDIGKYGDFIYELALEPSKSAYPTYIDGIKTKSDFFAAAEQAVLNNTSELLLFSVGGTVEGWISYDWIPGDRYLQLTGFSVNGFRQQALSELLELLEARFPGYTAYFGYPGDNRDAIGYLTEHGFRCIEQDWNHSFFFDGYTADKYRCHIEKISRDNFDKFRSVYHADSETYWNAERIFEAIDDWTIFVYNQESMPIASVFLAGDNGHYEIYGVEFGEGAFNECVFRELLNASLSECKSMGAKYMTYFCGEDERAVVSKLGFRCIGQYVLLIKKF